MRTLVLAAALLCGCNSFADFPEPPATPGSQEDAGPDISSSDAGLDSAPTRDMEDASETEDLADMQRPEPIAINFRGSLIYDLEEVTDASIVWTGGGIAFSLSDGQNPAVFSVAPDVAMSLNAGDWPAVPNNGIDGDGSSVYSAVRATNAPGLYAAAITSCLDVQANDSRVAYVASGDVSSSVLGTVRDISSNVPCTDDPLIHPTFSGGFSEFTQLQSPHFYVWTDGRTIYSLPESLDSTEQASVILEDGTVVTNLWGTTGSLVFAALGGERAFWRTGTDQPAGDQLGFLEDFDVETQDEDFAHLQGDDYIRVWATQDSVNIQRYSYSRPEDSLETGSAAISIPSAEPFRPRVATFPDGFAVFYFENPVSGSRWMMKIYTVDGSNVQLIDDFESSRAIDPTAVDLAATQLGDDLVVAAVLAWRRTRGGSTRTLADVERVSFPDYFP